MINNLNKSAKRRSGSSKLTEDFKMIHNQSSLDKIDKCLKYGGETEKKKNRVNPLPSASRRL